MSTSTSQDLAELIPAPRSAEPETPAAGGRWRRRAGVALTVVAGLVVFLALVAPREYRQLYPEAFLRLPVEALLGAGLVLVLPGRRARWVAVAAGALLGAVTVLRIFDYGFQAVLNRPFDPILDVSLLGDGLTFLDESFGTLAAVGAVVAVIAVVLGLLAVLAWAALRLTRVVRRHRRNGLRVVAVLTVVWLVCAVAGVTVLGPVPVASRGAAALAVQKVLQVPANIRDREAFATEVAADAFRATPGDRLLTGLRGKDVVLAIVESYGRVAVEQPEVAGGVNAVLDDGTQRLAAKGYAARSGFLTSSTHGGGSWLAHASLLTGTWIDNQRRYDDLHEAERTSLTSAFGDAGWRTVGVMPGNIAEEWPEAAFYGYHQVYDSRHLDYHGSNFRFAAMPDQYTLSAFERLEHSRADRGPLMAEIPLVSSHAPWSPTPWLLPWDQLGDGSVYDQPGMMPEPTLATDPAQISTDYGNSIEYTLSSLISYVETYGDDNLVLVFLGDHQPAGVVTGADASNDVPVTIVARDPKVLDQVAGWGWSEGLRPQPNAPVWPMNEFRDRFLTAFGSRP